MPDLEILTHNIHELLDILLHISQVIAAIYALAFLAWKMSCKFGDPLRWSQSFGDEEWKEVLKLVRTSSENIKAIGTEKEFKRIVELAHEAFGDKNISKDERTSLFEMWRGSNNGVFRLLKDPDSDQLNGEVNIIGYVCVLPLTEGAAKRYLQGKKISLFGFTANDIRSDAKARRIYVQAMYLEPDYRNKDYCFQLLSALLLCIAEFTMDVDDRDFSDIEILAETFTLDGSKLVIRTGFSRYVRKSILGYDIYVLKLNHEQAPGPATETVNAIRETRKHIKTIAGFS
jgi:hypothetical protein